MWLVFDTETGQQVGELLPDPPEPTTGRGAVQVPGTALAGLSVWSAERRAFVDIERRGRDEIAALFTDAEMAAILQTAPLEILRFIYAIPFLRRPIPKTEPFFVAGVTAVAAAGFLTPQRAAQVLAFTPPETPA